MIPIWRGFGFALGVVLSANSHADGAAIAKTGAGAAPACQTCHGEAGVGIAQAGFPRLAGLGAPSMQRQFDAFADGTRVSAVMMPIAKALSVGSVQGTRHDFHATEDSMYGREVAGNVLGASGAPKPFKLQKEKRS